MAQFFPAVDAHEAEGGADANPVADPQKNVSVTFYIPGVLRNRTRAAYRATALLEGDTSWSDLVRKALVTEIERRERVHNGCVPYDGDETPLPAGRPQR